VSFDTLCTAQQLYQTVGPVMSISAEKSKN
jgi:hypothetical protein